MLGAISLGILALLAIPWFRRRSYEIFLRGHQILTGLFVYGTWQHLLAQRRPASIYLFIALSIFALTSFLQLVSFAVQASSVSLSVTGHATAAKAVILLGLFTKLVSFGLFGVIAACVLSSSVEVSDTGVL
ncbi:hypothetical protein BDV29DRAFT_153488 [Aspergillus leporis]|uniref:Ferric oxidoreductase domain-containing protein n=1 Tax=Aspergillus leporis TaxID=41062 RepID=A0A5N5XA70_9EURO|nr:hypothetical protein BDV29DRAFT_153488 [Aspergillus leporis]